mgnify:CR=1 FL=1
MKSIEWMCSHCGKKELRSENNGRPQPGKCPRKTGDRPHTWVKNRTIGK